MKLAIIGTGKIVHEALYAVQPVKKIQLTAIFGRPHSRDKAEALAKQYQIPAVYTDYEQLLQEADADTVYIGLVNSVHYEYAKKALQAGKNVILEKPFTPTSAEAQELADLAKSKGLFLFEAITVLHTNIFHAMQETLPKLGNIKLMLCNYSQYSSRYDKYLQGEITAGFEPAYGGALNDLNVYNIHYVVALFGLPKALQYYPTYGYNGVDTSGTLMLTYDNFTAVCSAAKDSDSPCFVSVQGEKGWLRIDGKPNVAPALDTSVVEADKPPVPDEAGSMVRPTSQQHIENKAYHRMTPEFAAFADIIDAKDFAQRDQLLAETVNVVKVLELAHASVK